MSRRIKAPEIKLGIVLVLSLAVIFAARFHQRNNKPMIYPTRADRYFCDDYRNWADVMNFTLPKSDEFCKDRGL